MYSYRLTVLLSFLLFCCEPEMELVPQTDGTTESNDSANIDIIASTEACQMSNTKLILWVEPPYGAPKREYANFFQCEYANVNGGIVSGERVYLDIHPNNYSDTVSKFNFSVDIGGYKGEYKNITKKQLPLKLR